MSELGRISQLCSEITKMSAKNPELRGFVISALEELRKKANSLQKQQSTTTTPPTTKEKHHSAKPIQQQQPKLQQPQHPVRIIEEMVSEESEKEAEAEEEEEENVSKKEQQQQQQQHPTISIPTTPSRVMTASSSTYSPITYSQVNIGTQLSPSSSMMFSLSQTSPEQQSSHARFSYNRASPEEIDQMEKKLEAQRKLREDLQAQIAEHKQAPASSRHRK